MSKKRVLGRGFSQLLNERPADENDLIHVDVKSIAPNPYQPRQNFDEEALASLADSIKTHGLLSPVLLAKGKRSGYVLVAGERRFRAAKLAGLTEIPAILTDFDDKKMAEAALVENLERQDLGPIEEALAYQHLMALSGYTQDEMAKAVGKSRPYIANMLRLLDFPEEIKTFLSEKRLTPGQARPLLSLEIPAEQIQMARRIIDDGLSARQVEDILRRRKEEKKPRPDTTDQTRIYLEHLENDLKLAVGAPIRIRTGSGRSRHRGTISITFTSDDEFERIITLLRGNENEFPPPMPDRTHL